MLNIQQSFTTWLSARPEIEGILNAAKADPEDAIEYTVQNTTVDVETTSAATTPGLVSTADALSVVQNRSGQVRVHYRIQCYRHF